MYAYTSNIESIRLWHGLHKLFMHIPTKETSHTFCHQMSYVSEYVSIVFNWQDTRFIYNKDFGNLCNLVIYQHLCIFIVDLGDLHYLCITYTYWWQPWGLRTLGSFVHSSHTFNHHQILVLGMEYPYSGAKFMWGLSSPPLAHIMNNISM
jgi:hypothetical protein